jgi:hypothetical protein
MADATLVFTQTFAGTGAGTGLINSVSATGLMLQGYGNVTLRGGASGAVFKVERSYDAGSNWDTVASDSIGTASTFTLAANAGISFGVFEPEQTGALWRVNCTTYTAGTPAARMAPARGGFIGVEVSL